jgi:hypothetical protein
VLEESPETARGIPGGGGGIPGGGRGIPGGGGGKKDMIVVDDNDEQSVDSKLPTRLLVRHLPPRFKRRLKRATGRKHWL